MSQSALESVLNASSQLRQKTKDDVFLLLNVSGTTTLSTDVSFSVSIQRVSLAWGNMVTLPKQMKWIINRNKHYTHKRFKGIETFPMSYFGYVQCVQCCNNVLFLFIVRHSSHTNVRARLNIVSLTVSSSSVSLSTPVELSLDLLELEPWRESVV